MEKDIQNKLIDITYDEQVVMRSIRYIKYINYLGIRGEIFTQCMESPDDPDVPLDAINYENKSVKADVKDKIVPEQIKPAREKLKHCTA